MVSSTHLSEDNYAAASTEAALGYIDDVLSGRQVAGELVRLAVERHLADLRRAKKGWAYRFDLERALRVFRFFSYLTHWKGEWAGQQFILAPWQAFILWSVFGWVRIDGARRFRIALIQIGRKNGKTAIAAGVGLYLFAADGEGGAEVYSVATKREQARISHQDAVRMRRGNLELSSRIQAFKDNLSIDTSGSKFEPLGANVNTMDGLNVHGGIVDELHKHKTRDVWDAIEYGMGARRQPLMFAITTAGDNAESVCYEWRELAEKMLRAVFEYDALFAFVAEPDKADEDGDQKTWVKGNPNLGISVKLEKLQEDYAKAREMPSAWANFRRYRLDRWVLGGEDAWMNMHTWAECPAEVVALESRECYGGLDLASTQDIAAFVLYFEPETPGAIAHALCWFFLPEENLAERARHYRVPLEAWAEQGYLTLTPGNVIDYAFIRECINQAASKYVIKEIGYDDWNATQIVVELSQDGLTMVPLQQTVKTFNAPMHKLEDLVTAKQLNHGGNPVLRWMVSNVVTVSDPSGRIKPVKNKGKRAYKIDGLVALAMGVARALIHEEGVQVIELPEDYTVSLA